MRTCPSQLESRSQGQSYRFLEQIQKSHQKQTKTPRPCLLLADFNTELTISQTDNYHIGDHQAREEEETHSADLFNLLTEAKVFLPATFPSHAGERHNFTGITSAAGKLTKRSIDYVGLPIDWLAATTSSKVIYGFNTSQSKLITFQPSQTLSSLLLRSSPTLHISDLTRHG